MKSFFTTKRLCRAGVIAALYAALTYAFAPFAFGPLQFRPAEALCILPVFFPEAVPALYIGCMLSNLTSPYILFDVFLGSLATLLGALGTFAIGKAIKNTPLKIFLGGLSPVFFNTLIIPFIIVVLCGGVSAGETIVSAYFATSLSIFLTECLCVYGLGIPLYLFFEKRNKN